MCRNIRTLVNFDPPATDEEIRAASLQFVRKLSGVTAPTRANEAAFDRSVNEETNVSDALKLGLISMDSTMRSNLAVGLPIDLAVIRRDAIRVAFTERIDQSDPYFQELRESWSQALRAAHLAIPAPPYGSGESAVSMVGLQTATDRSAARPRGGLR